MYAKKTFETMQNMPNMQERQKIGAEPPNPNLPNQACSTKPTEPNLPNQTCQTKPKLNKLNLPNQTSQNISTKPNLPNLTNQTYHAKSTSLNGESHKCLLVGNSEVGIFKLTHHQKCLPQLYCTF